MPLMLEFLAKWLSRYTIADLMAVEFTSAATSE
jgi:hypothetical protein